MNTSVTAARTAGTRPSQRSSQLTGGVRTNGEQDGECDGHEHSLRPIEEGNDKYTTGECDPRFQGLRRIRHGVLRFTVWRKAIWVCSHLNSVGSGRWRTLAATRADRGPAEPEGLM